MVKEHLVQHHVKYKEIHGIDEVKTMSKGEHKKLHARLRRVGKCNIPPEELNAISIKAYNRSDRKTIYKSILISPSLHRYIMDHKDADHKSAEAVIYGLIGEIDELKQKVKCIEGLIEGMPIS